MVLEVVGANGVVEVVGNAVLVVPGAEVDVVSK